MKQWSAVLLYAWRRGGALVLGMLALSVVLGLVPALQADLLRRLFDMAGGAVSEAATKPTGTAIIVLATAYGGSLLIDQIGSVTSEYLETIHRHRVSVDALRDVMASVRRTVDLRVLENGENQDRLSRAVEGAQHGVSMALSSAARLLMSLVTIIAVAGLLSDLGWSTLALVAVSALVSSIARLVEIRAGYSRYMESMVAERRLGYVKHLLVSPAAYRELALQGGFDRMTDDGIGLAKTLGKLDRRHAVTKVRTVSVAAIVPTVSRILLAIVGVNAISDGTASVGDLSLLFSGFAALLAAVESLVAAIGGVHEGGIYFAQINDPLGTNSRSLAAGPEASPSEEETETARPVNLRFESVDFSYGDAPALVDFSHEFVTGSTTAIMGANGSGKSTLVKLASGLLHPASGNVVVNGTDLRTLDRERFWSGLAFFAQEPLRLEDSLRNNIDLSGAYGDEVADSARRAGLDGIVDRSASGIDQMVSLRFTYDAGGTDLSGGQWQRVALARVLLNATPTLALLDEPTAFLDPIAEVEVIATLRDYVAGTTAILVTHDVRLLAIVDQVLLLDQGRIVETGTPRDLLRSSERFRTYVEAQTDLYSGPPGDDASG